MKEPYQLKPLTSNVVVNLSDEEVPDAAYIFLVKGLGFVPARKVDMQDLKYDAEEFIRKLEWKAFFKANPDIQESSDLSGSVHNEIRVSSFHFSIRRSEDWDGLLITNPNLQDRT